MDKISQISYRIVLAIILVLECAFACATFAAFTTSPRAADKGWWLLTLFLWTAISCFFWFFGDMFFRNSYNPVKFKSPPKQLCYWKEQRNSSACLVLILPFLILIWPQQNLIFGVSFCILGEIRCVLLWRRARSELAELESSARTKFRR